MESKKKTIIQTIVCVVLVCMIWGGYVCGIKKIEEAKYQEIVLLEDDFSWVYQVDSVMTEKNKFVLQGFAFKLGMDAESGAFEILLRDIESGEGFIPKMEYVEREDVNDYFLCGFDYKRSGFEATISAKKLNLKEKNYEILLKKGTEKVAFQTGIFISDGKLVYTNPLEYEPLDVMDTELEDIVEDGILRVYRPDCGIYVYQYEGALFWIADSNYEFVEGDTWVEYQLATTQVEKLPAERLENKWYWDNIGFMFTSKEISSLNLGGYRVARCELPIEYSIERIWTGNYVDKWTWQQSFRPYYSFSGR